MKTCSTPCMSWQLSFITDLRHRYMQGLGSDKP